jgi:hypothetical protein
MTSFRMPSSFKTRVRASYNGSKQWGKAEPEYDQKMSVSVDLSHEGVGTSAIGTNRVKVAGSC